LGVLDVGWKQMLGTDFEEMGWQNGDWFMWFRVWAILGTVGYRIL